MSGTRWLFLALGVTVTGSSAVTTIAAQSVYPVRLDNHEAVNEARLDDSAEPLAAGSGASALTVEGEVLTTDPSGEPRLWGRGRPGTAVYISEATNRLCSLGSVKFGLSKHAVDWGSAADACPVGFWVCRQPERGTLPCDTFRLDSTQDGVDCAGEYLDWPGNNHIGWTANGGGDGVDGIIVTESENGLYSRTTCHSLPVWCCTE
jgi:hypothetical protein